MDFLFRCSALSFSLLSLVACTAPIDPSPYEPVYDPECVLSPKPARLQIQTSPMTPTLGLVIQGWCVTDPRASLNVKTFGLAAAQAGVIPLLNEPSPFTVFIPSDEAFEKYFKQRGISRAEFLKSSELNDLIRNHIIAQRIEDEALFKGGSWTTLSGKTLTIQKLVAPTLNSGVTIPVRNISNGYFSNGVYYLLDGVTTL
jgi:uncharacterized surface protein with fasciclin (FAS1) repeats